MLTTSISMRIEGTQNQLKFDRIDLMGLDRKPIKDGKTDHLQWALDQFAKRNPQIQGGETMLKKGPQPNLGTSCVMISLHANAKKP